MNTNIVVAHGGGPTPVINASLAGVLKEAKKREGGRVLAALHGIEGLLKEQFVDLTDLGDTDIGRLKNTPSSAIGTCRYKLKEQDPGTIVSILKKRGVGYFLYNGGNDSMDTCLQMSDISDDLRVIGIPKTIDNDLAVTDHSPGFGSAARFAAVATVELALDVAALPIHVSVIEFMGRNAGWIAAASALSRSREGDAPHLIYLPERAFIRDEFLADVEELFSRNRGVVVAVSEGLVDADGTALAQSGQAANLDSFGHPLPGNVSQLLATMISDELQIRARSEKPGLLGRVSTSSISSVDRDEAFSCGRFAMRSAFEGKSAFMAGFSRHKTEAYGVDHILIPLEQVANVEKRVPESWINHRGNDITEDFTRYASPLIGHELPNHFYLK